MHYVLAYTNYLEKIRAFKFADAVAAKAYIDSTGPADTCLPVEKAADLKDIDGKVLVAAHNFLAAKRAERDSAPFAAVDKTTPSAVFDLIVHAADEPPAAKKTRAAPAVVMKASLTVSMPILEDHIAQAKRDLAVNERLLAVAADIEKEHGHPVTVSFKRGRIDDPAE